MERSRCSREVVESKENAMQQQQQQYIAAPLCPLVDKACDVEAETAI